LNRCLKPNRFDDTFFYLEGPCEATNSSLINLAKALAGSQATRFMTNSDLNKDIHNFSTFGETKLLILNDHDENCSKYTGLKLLLSNDPFSVKLKTGTTPVDLNFNLTIIMVSTGYLDEIYSDPSLSKKAIRIPIIAVPKNNKDLYAPCGLFLNELPHLHYWASKIEEDRISELLYKYPKAVPSLKQEVTIVSSKSSSNSVVIWANKYLMEYSQLTR
jgi:hypothetical protein